MTLNSATGVVSATQVNGAGGYSGDRAGQRQRGSPSPAVATATLNFGVNGDSSYGGCSMFPVDFGSTISESTSFRPIPLPLHIRFLPVT